MFLLAFKQTKEYQMDYKNYLRDSSYPFFVEFVGKIRWHRIQYMCLCYFCIFINSTDILASIYNLPVKQ
jgi:hypothetical protein